jgi:hypothetical protein
MRLKILLGVGGLLLAVTYTVIHCVLTPTEVSLPIFVFQVYSNGPSGEQYAVASVTNNDSCAYTFRERFDAIIDKTNCWYVIHSSLANRTLASGGSSIETFQVPPHSARWIVVSVAIRHSFTERNFSWLFQTNRFDEVVETGWFP